LRLHPIEPSFEIDLLHGIIIADIACGYAFGLCVICWQTKCR
jgi:hypothetical protein